MFYEKQLTAETKYEGIIVNVRRDTVLLDNGRAAGREVVEHPGGVCVVAVTDGGDIVLVRQYRYAVGAELLEVPAGKLERGEDPFACAVRELSEETGYTAREWSPLLKLHSSPGFCEETLHVYLATGLTQEGAHPDEDEILCVEHVKFSQFKEMIIRGEISDSKTAAGALAAAARLGIE